MDNILYKKTLDEKNCVFAECMDCWQSIKSACQKILQCLKGISTEQVIKCLISCPKNYRLKNCVSDGIRDHWYSIMHNHFVSLKSNGTQILRFPKNFNNWLFCFQIYQILINKNTFVIIIFCGMIIFCGIWQNWLFFWIKKNGNLLVYVHKFR